MGNEWRIEVPLGFAGLRGKSDPSSFTLRGNTVGHGNKNTLVLGLAHDVDMAVADISGAFLHAVMEQPFYAKPPIEYRKPGIVWKVKRYLYGDKRALRCGQDHFETTMLNLNFERLESEPGCFVKKGATPKDSIIVVVHWMIF